MTRSKSLTAALAAFLMAFSLSSFAMPLTLMAEGPGFYVKVNPEIKCTNKKVDAILKKYKVPFTVKNMFKAQVMFEGKVVEACGMFREEMGAVVIVGEDGNGTMIPAQDFEKLTEI